MSLPAFLYRKLSCSYSSDNSYMLLRKESSSFRLTVRKLFSRATSLSFSANQPVIFVTPYPNSRSLLWSFLLLSSFVFLLFPPRHAVRMAQSRVLNQVSALTTLQASPRGMRFPSLSRVFLHLLRILPSHSKRTYSPYWPRPNRNTFGMDQRPQA